MIEHNILEEQTVSGHEWIPSDMNSKMQREIRSNSLKMSEHNEDVND